MGFTEDLCEFAQSGQLIIKIVYSVFGSFTNFLDGCPMMPVRSYSATERSIVSRTLQRHSIVAGSGSVPIASSVCSVSSQCSLTSLSHPQLHRSSQIPETILFERNWVHFTHEACAQSAAERTLQNHWTFLLWKIHLLPCRGRIDRHNWRGGFSPKELNWISGYRKCGSNYQSIGPIITCSVEFAN